MLVLGMASAANATVLTWSTSAVTIPTISGTTIVTINADDDMGYDPIWVGFTAPATPAASITSIVGRGTSIVGPDAQVKTPAQTTYAGWWTVMALDLATPITIESGPQWDVTIKGYATGVTTLYSGTDTIDVTVLPEPMTVALLGLGSLFLLRRRK